MPSALSTTLRFVLRSAIEEPLALLHLSHEQLHTHYFDKSDNLKELR